MQFAAFFVIVCIMEVFILKSYEEFIKDKSNLDGMHGFDPIDLPDFLFDFQKYIVDWSIRKGRCAVFADCGLGKTPMQLVWSDNVYRKTKKPVLIITPLSVSYQTKREADKFGYNSEISKDGKVNSNIVITNYERLSYFDFSDFGGVVCDESGILKNFKGTFKKQITTFMRKIEYRLLATATAAPNDYIELGTSSEALGYMGYMDMLGKFFKNDQNSCAIMRRGRFHEATKWRLKYHAEDAFWHWCSSWSISLRRPSDIGFADNNFDLPELNLKHTVIDYSAKKVGGLFQDIQSAAVGLKEVRTEIKHSVEKRCELAADIANNIDDYVVIWCNLNSEGDLLQKLVNDSVQVSGRDSDEVKSQKLVDFSLGRIKKLIIKPKIGGFGLNWQHCNRVIFFPTYSYEQYYQAVRRCWRFGQKREVFVNMIYTNGMNNVVNSLLEKSEKVDTIFDKIVLNSNNIADVKNKFKNNEELPEWL